MAAALSVSSSQGDAAAIAFTSGLTVGSQACGGVEGHPRQVIGEAENTDVRQTAGIKPSPQAAIAESSTSTGGPEETPAIIAASTAGDSDATDHIHEIFYFARKLIAEDRRQFVLDEETFMAELDDEPLPLFLRGRNEA
jgi:hypothetical protein